MIPKLCILCKRVFYSNDINKMYCDNCLPRLPNPYTVPFISQKPVFRPMVERKPISQPIQQPTQQPVQVQESEEETDENKETQNEIEDIERQEEEQDQEDIEQIQTETNKKKSNLIAVRLPQELLDEINKSGYSKTDLVRESLKHYLKKHLNRNETDNNIH